MQQTEFQPTPEFMAAWKQTEKSPKAERELERAVSDSFVHRTPPNTVPIQSKVFLANGVLHVEFSAPAQEILFTRNAALDFARKIKLCAKAMKA